LLGVNLPQPVYQHLMIFAWRSLYDKAAGYDCANPVQQISNRMAKALFQLLGGTSAGKVGGPELASLSLPSRRANFQIRLLGKRLYKPQSHIQASLIRADLWGERAAHRLGSTLSLRVQMPSQRPHAAGLLA